MPLLLMLALTAAVMLSCGCVSDAPAGGGSPDGAGSQASDKVNITIAVHWQWQGQLDGLKRYTDEYTTLHPDVVFNIVTIPYGEYADKLQLLYETGNAPDIYQIYSSWGVGLVENGMLARPPDYVIEDVEQNYVSTSGVTINGEIWGIPTEINDFTLVYDKKMFREAGLVDSNGEAVVPETWDELVDTAKKLSKKDAQGNIEVYGIAFLKEDWQVVDPFLSLLYSNNGEYLSADQSEALFNSPEGVEALDKILVLFRENATDGDGSVFKLGNGTVAMAIAPPWLEGTFKANFGDRFEADIGVAPIPKLKKPASLQYSWFMGVMQGSENDVESWKFLKWISSDIQEDTGTTRYGDLLADVIGAIPSRTIDVEGHESALGSAFKATYVRELSNSVPEPNVKDGNKIKAALMNEILSAWAGTKTAKEALDDAKTEVDAILSS
jgi:multiple sugar transport system substrate-binding protein